MRRARLYLIIFTSNVTDDLNVSRKTGNQFLIPLEEYLNAWMAAARIGRNKKGLLFRTMGKGDRRGERAMSRFDVLHMIKRRAEAAGLPYATCSPHVSCHRNYRLSAERWNARACPDHRESRIAPNN